MNTNKHFDFQRFWLLLKLEFHKGKKGFWITLGIIYGLAIIGLLVSVIFGGGNTSEDHANGYEFILLTSGFILTSLSMSDLSHSLRRYSYLTLPVSNLERFLSIWVLTSFGWIVAFTLTYVVFLTSSHALIHLLFQKTVFQPFYLFSGEVWNTLKTYMVFQGVFLVGAAHFKGYVIPKTLLALLGFAFVCGIVGYFILADLFPFDMEFQTEPFDYAQLTAYKAWMYFLQVLSIVLAPLCWVITYFSIKEQEV